MSPLTPRERTIIEAWWNIGSVKSTAIHLGLAESTVKNALREARRKTGCSNTLMLAKWYMKKKVA